MPVLLEVVKRALGRVDRNVREVRPAQPLELGIEVRKVAALQQRIIAEVDARHDIVGAECDLLGLREEIIDAAVEHQPADLSDRHFLFGNELRRVQHIEGEFFGKRVIEELQAQFPFRVVSRLNGIPEVAPMEIGIGAVDLDRFVPHHGLQSELRLPVEFDEGRFAFGIDQTKGVNAEAFHEPERARDRAIRHDPHDHVHAFRHERDEIPEIIVSGLRLRKVAVGLLLRRVNQIGKLDRVLDKKDRNIVPDDVPVTLLRVELHREAAHIPGEIRRAFVAGDGREAHECWGLLTGALEEIRTRQFGQGFIVLEIAVSSESTRMHDSLRNPLMVEVEDLLAKMKIFEQCRSARPDAKGVLIIRDRDALLGGQDGHIFTRRLVQFSSLWDFPPSASSRKLVWFSWCFS